MTGFVEISALLGIHVLLLLFLLFVVIVWEAIWKSIALWKSARNRQLAWFIAIFIINSIGILPILYIYCFQKKRKS